MTTVATYARQIRHRLGLGFRGFGPNFHRTSESICEHAKSASQSPLVDGKPPAINIKARALRLHNRNANQASIYERKHVILAEGLRK